MTDMSCVQLQAPGAPVRAGAMMPCPPALRDVELALHNLRYGSIQLVVHDGKIVRIERIERIRLTEPSEAPTAATTPTDHRPGGPR